jgi:hypothetical protein
MMILYKILRQTTFLLISLMLFPAMLSAQSRWVDYGQQRNLLSAEIIKPVRQIDQLPNSTDFQSDFTNLSGAIFLTGKYAVGNNFVLVADISMVHAGLEGDENSPQTIMGNPYIGAEYYLPETPLFFELGMRIPVVPEDKVVASVAGVISDYDRAEAFIPKIIPVYGSMNFEKIFESNILLRAGTGLTLWFNSKEFGSYRDPMVSFEYILQTGYDHPRVNIMLGLVGRADLSSGSKQSEKLDILQFGTTITFPFGNFRPGINFRIPANKRAEEKLDYVFALNLAYVFK